MRSGAGRGLRVLLGLALIYWGFAADGGWLIGVIGLVPIYAATMNLCFFGPLFGYSVKGVKRAA